MSRRAWWWLLLGVLLVFDVVTVVYRLVTPGWQFAILGLTALPLAGYGALLLLDRRMQRSHEARALEQLERVRAAREH